MTPDTFLVADARAEAWAGPDFPAEFLRSPDEARAAFDRADGARSPVAWIAGEAAQLSALARHAPRRDGDHRLLLLTDADWAEREVLRLVFRVVVSPGQGMRLLAGDELREALAAPGRRDLVIGGFASPRDAVVVLYRGTLEPLVVPFAWFQRRPGVRLDFASLGVTDHGQTVTFGEHEVAVESILYAHDAAYRARARGHAGEDDSLGASVRRLRLSHGLRRGEFPGVPDAEIARIERGDVAPHRHVLETIAARLGVPVDALGTY